MATHTLWDNTTTKELRYGQTLLGSVSYHTLVVQTYNSGNYNATTNKSKVDLTLSLSVVVNSGSIKTDAFNITVKNPSYPAENKTFNIYAHTYSSNTTTTLLSTSFDITHRTVGTRKVDYLADEFAVTAISGIVPITAEHLQLAPSSQLSFISYNRVPSVSLPSGTKYFGDAISVSVSTPIANADVYVQIGNNTTKIGSISGTSGSVSYTHASDTTLYAQYPNQAYVPHIFYATNSVGNGSTKTLNMYMPTSVKPSISSVTYQDVSGKASKYDGILIQGVSKLQTTVTASGIYGSSIQSYTTNTGVNTYTTNPFTTGVLNNTSYTFVTKVTDSRSREATKNTNITVQPYAQPVISNVNAYRCDSSGVQQTDGEYARVVIDYSISALSNLNTKSLKVKVDSGTEQTISLTNYSASSYDLWTQGLHLSGITANASHTIKLTLIDDFNNIVLNTQIPIARSHIDFVTNSNGDIGVGIGIGATINQFKVGLPVGLGSLVGGCSIRREVENNEQVSFSVPQGYVGLLFVTRINNMELYIVYNNYNTVYTTKVEDHSKSQIISGSNSTLVIKALDSESFTFIGNATIQEVI